MRNRARRKQGDFFAVKRRHAYRLWGLLLLLTYGAMVLTQYDVVQGLRSIPKAAEWGITQFYPNRESFSKLPDILRTLQETLLMSIAASSVAAVFALFFAIMGSQAVGINAGLKLVSRTIATIFRNIDITVWSMILLFSFGQNVMTGYFALFFGSFGFLTRAFLESIDESSGHSVEALRATGAGYATIICQSVIPSVLPQLISWILFMIETNIRNATLIGILTGTGVGFLFNLYYKNLNYSAASLIVLIIVASILIIEFASNYIRKVVIG
ncbi:PhnE/PtxC family ABC transporter permease [Paenibacillus azoreducens]|uniref:PhnE/PtxC family ABC transporter permease n=1 Tax=Paenibacillus azoreducens TaxID=116718 RepID=UPI001F00E899|nr:ABC transporter permease subunit [Paenibacillus azoreducens]